MNISLILTYFSIASGVLPLLAAWYNYKQLDGVLKLFVVFCIVSVAFDLLDMVLAFLKMQNNSPLLHLYILVSVLFYTVIYYKVFYKAVFKKIALLLGTITLIAMVCSAIFIQYIWTYPSISNTVLSLLMIVLSLTYFYQLLTLQEFVHIDKQGMFWINAGILFYFSINIFLFMLFNQINVNVRKDYYMIQSITNIIANILYLVGLLCKPQKTT